MRDTLIDPALKGIYRREPGDARRAREQAAIVKMPRLPARDVLVIEAGIVVEIRKAFTGAGDGETLVSADDYPGAVIGQPLLWPRARRQQLMDAAQWTQSEPVRAAKGEAWAAIWDAYMQSLRDLPETCPDPAHVVWPKTPEV